LREEDGENKNQVYRNVKENDLIFFNQFFYFYPFDILREYKNFVLDVKTETFEIRIN